MVVEPLSRDELFQILVKTDEDAELEQIVFHDATNEDLGNIVSGVIEERYLESTLTDVMGLLKHGLIPSWIRKQIYKEVTLVFHDVG